MRGKIAASSAFYDGSVVMLVTYTYIKKPCLCTVYEYVCRTCGDFDDFIFMFSYVYYNISIHCSKNMCDEREDDVSKKIGGVTTRTAQKQLDVSSSY